MESVNTRLLKEKESLGASVTVNVVQVEEAELDEMWSFVRNKQNQRWLWQALLPN
ncbi:hypothetical protein [Candidiatus Paracoxiella cheracis]|uniref:hypothetical protein n=1 Tax=Candidiatus Paracoxiella cheracis TaxID=3405120 RepID=UPI003BF59B89